MDKPGAREQIKQFLLTTLAGLPLPGVAAIVRFIDARDTDARFVDVEERLAVLEEAREAGSPASIAAAVNDIVAAARSAGGDSVDLRHAASCFEVLRRLSDASENAVQWDPILTEQESIEALAALPGVENPRAELEIVAHELKRIDLVCLQPGSLELGAGEKLFARTDALFQPWNPRADGLELCRRGVPNMPANMQIPEDVSALGWGPRRLNPAIQFLLDTERAESWSTAHPYIARAISFTTEARLFVEEAEKAAGSRAAGA